MTNKKSNDSSNNYSRRKFIQGGALLGATLGLSSLTGGKTTKDVAIALGKKQQDNFPHEVSSDYKRYDEKRTTQTRMMLDSEFAMKLRGLPGIFGTENDESKPGYTSLDYALNLGARSVDFDFGHDLNSPLTTWEKKPLKNKYQFASKEDAGKAIKKAAKFYGADLVGITAYDERWTYDPMYSLKNGEVNDSEFPFKPKSVIVMAFEMDYDGMSTAPSLIAEATTMLGYSNMSEVNYKLSSFIRGLGYNAFGAGNDTALSVPYGIAAGLGEQGRQGLLITYEYGPRVRLCKVFTEMELPYDKPIKFGANDFCKVCKKCAYSCPSQSIPYTDEMTWNAEVPSISNHDGILKYYVDVESCFVYWNTIRNGCSTCISSCPFNKPDFWHHKITTALTSTPLKPFLNEMDDLFGYGDIFDEQACINFWDLDVYTK